MPDLPDVKKVTPILVVDAIEPCLPFWTEALGFETTATVPHGDALGFVILQRGAVEIMLQTGASVADDIASVAELVAGQTATLFLEVDDVDTVERALEELDEPPPVVVPRRTTFYGMDEVFVRAPGGAVVGFAARIAEGEA